MILNTLFSDIVEGMYMYVHRMYECVPTPVQDLAM